MADKSCKRSVKKKQSNSKKGNDVSEISRRVRRPKKSTSAKNKEVSVRQKRTAKSVEAETGRRACFATRNPEQPSTEQLQELRKYVKETLDKGVAGLLEEFESVKKYNLDPLPNVAHLANTTRNRYKDIYCVDPTRVILEGGDNNYVHANHVKGEPFINDFVATQGPLENTLDDFWRMMIQENVGYIIMLCDLIELGKKKCEKYIPEKVDETRAFKDIKVRLMEFKDLDPQFVMSTLLVEAPNSPSRIIFHYQWKAWPDHGVPVTTNAALRVLSAVRGSTFTAVVHCSAGVGRTGTLIAVEYVLQQIMKAEKVDMKKMLIDLRNQRAHSIQTNWQYVYVAQCAMRLWTKVDKERMIPELTNEEVFLKFTAEIQAANKPKEEPK